MNQNKRIKVTVTRTPTFGYKTGEITNASTFRRQRATVDLSYNSGCICDVIIGLLSEF